MEGPPQTILMADNVAGSGKSGPDQYRLRRYSGDRMSGVQRAKDTPATMQRACEDPGIGDGRGVMAEREETNGPFPSPKCPLSGARIGVRALERPREPPQQGRLLLAAPAPAGTRLAPLQPHPSRARPSAPERDRRFVRAQRESAPPFGHLTDGK